MKIKTRNEIPELLNELKLEGVGVEVGTQTGKFSEVILNKSHLNILWSIDCWEHQEGYEDIANHGNWRQKYYHLKTIWRLDKFGDRSKIIKAYSKDIPKEYNYLNELDFVYIDADHTYEGCKEDLEIWYSRVKKGGVLAGHDYFNGDIDECKNCGVKKAVDEFMTKHNEKIHTTLEDNPKSWYVIKGGNSKEEMIEISDGKKFGMSEGSLEAEKYLNKIKGDKNGK